MRSSAQHRDGGRAAPGDRGCTRTGCPEPAVATLTYIYAASTAVVGPLAVYPEPHTYDLCKLHARSLTAPRGWELVRHDGDLTPPPRPDDLAALAEAVRETSHPTLSGRGRGPGPDDPEPGPTRPSRRNHPPRPRERGNHLRLIPPR